MQNDRSAREVVDSSSSEFLTTEIARDISDKLRKEENIKYIVKCPFSGFETGSEIKKKAISQMVQNNSVVYITNKRIILCTKVKRVTNRKLLGTDETNDEILADHIPFQYVSEATVKTGGLLSLSKFELVTTNKKVSKRIHKDMSESRASAIENFILNSRSPEWVRAGVGSMSQSRSVRNRVMVNVEIIEDYGIDLPEQEYRLTVSPELIKFEYMRNDQVQNTKVIRTENIDFTSIKTSRKRDFDIENRGRYWNILNPLMETDSQTKKGAKRHIEFPVKNSNEYVQLSLSDKSDSRSVLSCLADAEKATESTKQKTAKDTEQNSTTAKNDSPIATLKQRLAAGEISIEEFEELKDKIE